MRGPARRLLAAHSSPRNLGLAPDFAELQDSSRPLETVRSAAVGSPTSIDEGMPRKEQRDKGAPMPPDLEHKEVEAPLLRNSWPKPALGDSQHATRDAAEMSVPPECRPTSGCVAAGETRLEVGMCRKLCEDIDGRFSDAVRALVLLVQRGCHVPKDIYYRALRRCMELKDLVSGKLIHDLTVKSGYEGDAFLATHLMGLYASNGRLEEAMQVFIKVSRPTAYNWATIIFAHTRYGKAAQAIRLYRQMRHASALHPDNRVYVAVLKACALAGDLATGKEIHTHILGSPRKSDTFVETGLLEMYAKCGSLEDARRVFDRLAERNVVTWNTMLAGYAQQGMGWGAISLYSRMQQEGLTSPDPVTFVCLLQACAGLGGVALQHGQHIHAEIARRGLQDDVVLGGSLVMFSTVWVRRPSSSTTV